MSRIDAHHHVWDLRRRPQPWTEPFPALQRSFGLEELVPALDRAGVAGTVVVQTVDSSDETDELLAMAAGSERVRGVVGWFDLAAHDLPDTLATARSGPGGDKLVGARHQLQLEPDPGWLERTDVRAGLRALASVGLRFDLVVSPEQLPVVHRTVADLGEVRFVLDHCGKPPLASGRLDAGRLDSWSRDMRRLSELPNVAVKLSGLVTEADWSSWTVDQLRPVSELVLESFGPRRTMVGSDWPVCLLAASYEQVVSSTERLVSGLSVLDQAEVWSGSAIRWYGLERP